MRGAFGAPPETRECSSACAPTACAAHGPDPTHPWSSTPSWPPPTLGPQGGAPHRSADPSSH
eukprot:2962921-Pyramimonas_sp.AAC.1